MFVCVCVKRAWVCVCVKERQTHAHSERRREKDGDRETEIEREIERERHDGRFIKCWSVIRLSHYVIESRTSALTSGQLVVMRHGSPITNHPHT